MATVWRGRRGLAVGVAALAAAVALSGAGCGASPDPMRAYRTSYARTLCRRIFECCALADIRGVSGATDEASCETAIEHELDTQNTPLVAAGTLRFDEPAAAKCLTDLEGACPAVFDPKVAVLMPCGNVFVPAVPLGGPCADDYVCQSLACESNSCVTRVPSPCEMLMCNANEFCDGTGGCPLRPGAGAPCPDFVCADGLTCVAGACGTPLADGQPCTAVLDCAGTCSSILDTSARAGTCRPALCQGADVSDAGAAAP